MFVCSVNISHVFFNSLGVQSEILNKKHDFKNEKTTAIFSVPCVEIFFNFAWKNVLLKTGLVKNKKQKNQHQRIQSSHFPQNPSFFLRKMFVCRVEISPLFFEEQQKNTTDILEIAVGVRSATKNFLTKNTI